MCARPEDCTTLRTLIFFGNGRTCFEGNGPHLSRGGVRVLTENLLHALRHRPGQGPVHPVREKRNGRSIPAAPNREPANKSAPLTAPPLPQPQPLPPPPDNNSAASSPPPPPENKSEPPPPPPENKSAEPPPPPPENKSASPPSPPPENKSAAPPPPPPAPPAHPSPPLPTDQPGVPFATSTPSTDSSLSFSSPPSPMALPNHLESLIRSGIKMVPLTPNIARSRVMLNSPPYKTVPVSPPETLSALPSNFSPKPPPTPPPRSLPGPSPKPPRIPPPRPPPRPSPGPSPGHLPKLSPARPPPPFPRAVITKSWTHRASAVPGHTVMIKVISGWGPAMELLSPVTTRRQIKRRTVRLSNQRNLVHVPCKKITSSPTETNQKLAVLNVRSLCNKSFLIHDFISSFNLDFMFLTETWLDKKHRSCSASGINPSQLQI
ncbi:uncharacterized protein LOC129410370 [Boleophthalmus pectinirostris]|uniref:uncharacterized protein LOC129410370 n=1 Tax=Boleophthalmus pectinirostris TaxID=150288 RepID=UPI00242DFBC0|nr:uncharacterized protein LOC129410370 [Boleophthalmus pectinirostris]